MAAVQDFYRKFRKHDLCLDEFKAPLWYTELRNTIRELFYEVKDKIIYSICGNFDYSDYADDDGHADCGQPPF